MPLSIQPYKGARDFYPEDKRLQKYMFGKLRDTAERFGYEEYDAPILEPLELYAAKSGEEIVNEQTYMFEDRGGRKVAIRPEMTPTVSRMVAARRQESAYPLRWYSIPNLWRYERPQRGRLREHWQFNADLFGVADLSAEHEAVLLADSIMKSYGAEASMYEIRINSRQLMNYVFGEYLGLDAEQAYKAAKLVDRMHKIDAAAFTAQAEAICTDEQRASGVVGKLTQIVGSPTAKDLPVEVRQHTSVVELERLMNMLASSGVTNARFDPSVMRGLDYYTGIVFEVFDLHPDNNRSMFGGGRYDGLVGMFGVEPVPTVGFAMGDVTLQDFLTVHGLLPQLQPETDIYAILIGDVLEAAQPVLRELRQQGVRIAVDVTGRKLDKQIRTAEKKGINNVLFVGAHEIEQGQYKLKNLQTGNEAALGASQILAAVRSEPRTQR